MLRRIIIVTALLASTAAYAAEAPAPKPTVEQLQAQIEQLQAIINILKQQRDQGNDQIASLGAQLTVMQAKQAPAPTPAQGK